jgi:DNA-directed RNA polymerase subunit M/transcription elongation factor TFIIS
MTETEKKPKLNPKSKNTKFYKVTKKPKPAKQTALTSKPEKQLKPLPTYGLTQCPRCKEWNPNREVFYDFEFDSEGKVAYPCLKCGYVFEFHPLTKPVKPEYMQPEALTPINAKIRADWLKNKDKPKTERINQKLNELEKEKTYILSNIHKPRTRPKPSSITKKPCELSPTEIRACFTFLALVILFAIPNFIFPNIYGLALCIYSMALFLFVLFFRLTRPRQFTQPQQ